MAAVQTHRGSGGRRLLRGATAALSIAALAPAAALVPATATAADAAWSVEAGELRVSVPLRPGGAFEAKSAALRGRLRASGSKPVALAGELTLDLTTIDTGIDLRNRHLRDNYLEVGRGTGYDKAVLSEIRVQDADGPAFRGSSAFTATLLLHGTKFPVSGSCEIREAPAGVRVEASFPVSLRDFAIEPPQYMGVGVGNKVLVRVTFAAAPQRGAAE